MMFLRRFVRSWLAPLRRAVGTHTIPSRLDAIDEHLRRLDRARDRPARATAASASDDIEFLALDMPDGGVYHLAVDPRRRDAYQEQVASGAAHDATWRLLVAWVRPGDVVLDLGANIGSIAIPLAVRGARVHAFELLHDNARLLAAAAERNGLTTVSVVLGAVWDSPGCVGFAGHSAWGTVTPGSTLLTAAIAIDDYVRLQDVGRVDVMKLDVEGSEKQALLGARRLLARDHPDIILESNVLTCGGAGYAYRELLALLAPFGYRLYRVFADRLCPVGADTMQEVVLVDYLASVKEPAEIRARCGLALTPMTDADLVSSILAQAQENDFHRACVIAAAPALPAPVRNHPAVAPLLLEWEPLRHAPFFDRIRTGLGVPAPSA